MTEKKDTTHVLLNGTLVLCRRERSSIWQCRYKVDGKWLRSTTKEKDFDKARDKARELMIEAEIRKRSNLPVVTRKFSDVAKLAIQRMKDDKLAGKGKVSFDDYIRVIEDYLIKILGKRLITNIDTEALLYFDTERTKLMEKAATRSTQQTHNSALNKVFDEAVIRGFLTEANRPKLDANGKKSERRAAFTIKEVIAMLAGFDDWINNAINEKSKKTRLLLRDYVCVLLDTGARPGKELLNLKWNQITSVIDPVVTETGGIVKGNEDGNDDEAETILNLNRSVSMPVTGKTGTRTIVGMSRTVDALLAIAKRNYPKVEFPLLLPLNKITTIKNNDYVFRVLIEKDGEDTFIDVSESFQKMFDRYLKEHNLLIDPLTGLKRTFYGLRHTYATLALINDKVPIHTLAKQLGTSVIMIERHYSHLQPVQAIDQLRGEETRRLINAGGVIDEAYKSKRKKRKAKV